MTKAAAGSDRAAGGSHDTAPGILNIKGTPSFLNTDRKAAGKSGKEPSSLQPFSPGPAHYHVRDTVIRRSAHSPPAWRKASQRHSQKHSPAAPAQGPVATSLLHATTRGPRMSISITEDFDGARAQPTVQPPLSPTVTGLLGTSAFKASPRRPQTAGACVSPTLGPGTYDPTLDAVRPKTCRTFPFGHQTDRPGTPGCPSTLQPSAGPQGEVVVGSREQEAVMQPDGDMVQSKLHHVKGVLPWAPPHRVPMPEDGSAPWQLHVPVHLAAMLAASEGRHVGVIRGEVPEFRITNGHVLQLSRPHTAAAALSTTPGNKLMAKDMRGSRTARTPKQKDHKANVRRRHDMAAANATKLASGPDPFSARRPAVRGRPATAVPRPSTAVAGPDLLALRPATSKLGGRYEISTAVHRQPRKCQPLGRTQPLGSAWPALLDQDAAARATSSFLNPKIKGVPFCKLLGSHDPNDHMHYDKSSTHKRSAPRESLYPVPAEPGVMVIPSGTMSVPKIPLGIPNTSMPDGNPKAAEVLRLDEDLESSTRNSLPSRPGSRSGPEITAQGFGHAGSLLLSRPGSRAGPETISEECGAARSLLMSRPGSSAGPESRLQAGSATRSARVSGSNPSIAPIPESSTSDIQPDGSITSLSGIKEPTDMLIDAEGSLVAVGTHRPEPSPAPEIMTLEPNSESKATALNPESEPDSTKFTFSQSGPNVTDALPAEAMNASVGMGHTADGRQQSSSDDAGGDILAGFRKGCTGTPPGQHLDNHRNAHPDSSLLSEPQGQSDSRLQDPGSEAGLAHQSEADAADELQFAHAGLESSIPSTLALGPSNICGLNVAGEQALQKLDFMDRPGTCIQDPESRDDDIEGPGTAAGGASSTLADQSGSTLSSRDDYMNDSKVRPEEAVKDRPHVPAARAHSAPSSSDGGEMTHVERPGTASKPGTSMASHPQFRFAPALSDDEPIPGTAAIGGAFQVSPRRSASSSGTNMSGSLRPGTSAGRISTGDRSSTTAFSAALLPQQSPAQPLVPRLSLPRWE
ncbi:hypothetical protein WJX74_002357 [Apatococcus lobatus]|uniref:Uncharacterized protein n=1 Tax=Apatococcus lobatus TaxID=904363 RepID=A0AAW1QKP3_9CHLO